MSLTDQEAAILVEALSELSRGIKVGANFTYQYNCIESLLQRIEATTGKTRQQLGWLGWRTPPTFKMVNALEAIESELNSEKTDS
ncbi:MULTISPECIES: hypothetical protein [unclassified Leptolyngbya]|uniref:hypothetical protein n=1 Tax=unclassified Leptolyngbya TaxID=2650499 RepID=UPI0016845D21|nr:MULTISPECIES: hypothetical protein [unclassified Leptolyngbya]MBD1913193.1 hypothetical protein [Leptolyngbya sp. FACHB-8]MBD2154915.1 hypothetical protein [Leptolyngbya sp. FACHB-16]